MTFIDIILIIFLAGFVFYGLFFGFIRTLGALVGILAGLLVASHFYGQAFEWIGKIFFGHESAGRIVVFLLLFTIANRLVALGFSLLNSAFNVISIIPFLKSINRLAGALFGFLLGVSILGLLLYFISLYPFLASWFGKFFAASKVMPYLSKVLGLLAPIVPGILESINEYKSKVL